MSQHDPINADLITVERIERCLDTVAIVIEHADPNGAVYLPIYRRLERELAAARERDESMASVKARVARLRAARSRQP